MFYVYLLASERNEFYIGCTQDLRTRLVAHQKGLVKSTKNKRPVKLYYYEAYVSSQQAYEREYKLKQFGSSYIGLLKRLNLK